LGFVARTNIGKVRSENQDGGCAFVHADYFIGIVADGMGGHRGGATASKLAIRAVKACLLEKLTKDADEEGCTALLKEAYTLANAEIYARSKEDKELEGMGTTLTVALLKNGRLLVAHIGDSRAYIADEQKIFQLTVDQTFVQKLIDSGEITPEEAKTHPQRHMIMEAVGTEKTICPVIYSAEVKQQTVMLCSDGLYGEVSDEEIHKTMTAADDLATAADKLVVHANVNGGMDNITVVLLCETM